MPQAAPLSTEELIAAHQAATTDALIAAHQQQVAAAKSPARVNYTAAESIGRGALQGVSLGFSDEGAGILSSIKKTMSRGSSNPGVVESYRQGRDEERAKDAMAQKDNPGSYMIGNIGGGIASSFIPGLGAVNAAKGASVGAKFVQAARVGAGQGALIGLGTSNADVTKGDIGTAAMDTTIGAGVGSALSGVGSLIGSAFSGAINRFKSAPENRAVKAVTGQNISALRQISGTTLKSAGDVNRAQDNISKVGRDILDEAGVLGAFDKVEDIAPKLANARVKYGKLIGEVADKIDETLPGAVSAKNISQKIVDYAADIPPTEAGKKLQNRLLEEAANFEKIGAFGFKDAQKFKGQFKFKAVDADALIGNQDATNAVRKIISKEMEDTAENLVKIGSDDVKDLVGNYKLFKSKYGSFKAASDAATDRGQKNLTNRFISPSDYGIGTALGLGYGINQEGFNPKALLYGAAGAAGNKFLRERGSAMAARAADGIIKTLRSDGIQGFVKAAAPLIEAAKQGNKSALMTFQIMQQADPKAVEILNQQEAMRRRAGAK